ncbi:hypothetical protein LSCM1_04306 [Leishmania martiniquensis]|uniref:RanBP2-type domain-containing protein n=1 Tax=Leishmania martiniquensis TaxID=1580590 RepID=A0A836GJY8_9TRYP|nr:hypothetical protein LSCM1_04306 [Leishmania martiniquensis]
MRGSAGARRGRKPSLSLDDRESSFSSLSYSYDASRTLSRSHSYTSSASSSSSDEHPRRGHRRFRSWSPSEDAAHKQPRSDSVLGDDLSFTPGSSVPLPYHPSSSSSAPMLPAVLGDAVLPETYDGQFDSVLGAPDTPNEDWPCGVCSNINSKQRASCFRCGCHYAESLLAMPGYEVSLTHLPASCTAAMVEEAVRRVAPNCSLHYIGTDTAKGIMYIQFSSVEEATKCLVQSHCELRLRDGDGEDGAGVRTRLSFSLGPHPLHERKEAEEQLARATAQAAAERQEAALEKAGVPRFLWPHTWRQPPAFPSAEKQKAFLSTMSTHWDHLSEEQKRYYDAEVKKALLRMAAPIEPTGKKDSMEAMPPVKSGIAADVTAPLSTEVSSASLPSTPAGAKESSKTSHALDGLKKRLAERKSAMKRVEGTAGAKVTTVAGATVQAAGPVAVHGRDGTSGGTGGTASLPPSLRKGGGDFPLTPSKVPAEMLLWDGFPVPLQYTSLSKVPRSIELPRVPMPVCERLLPPALLQVARMQFKQAR